MSKSSKIFDILILWPESSRFKMAVEERRRGVCYTMPGLKHEKLLKVPITEEAQLCFERHFPRVDGDLNLRGLRNLISSSQLELALNGTTVILSQMGQGEGAASKPSTMTPLHAEMWGIRSQLLMALKLYPQLIEELLPFEELDAPDLYYQYYSNGNEKTGSLIPFSMRLIHAEVLRFTPFPWKAVERIERLEAGVKKVFNLQWLRFVPKSWLLQVITMICSSGEPEEYISAWRSRLSVVQKMYARVLFFLGVPTLFYP
ncbi:unnamed protein product [Nippostrongylus brasiliensis]|uniref:Dynein heavy chain 7, axonemal n=1 Tax=Nippostrongylus brasiliensis TaxID=27835 RepID=A0A158R127_NIPBR|nr:unnamed protein product [Nippostrongylus brasiliensis]